MTRRYLAVLQFQEDGPAVTGEWEKDATARGVYRDWIGLYTGNPAVIVQLLEETDGVRRTLRRWTAQGEVVDGSDHPGS
ncbi:hypothetical protein [Streptomyces minutiscleroticus]|uniref:hypothetical protein n=1 Tax=Streptomyces minutiscleroticus TaxID=68238 RepID=UPI003327E0E1